ncbi:MAG: branched-chain amino acid aminotransferase [Candidatus Marinimicrobia bacterium]|nr:branched-chain amino acid aminotransferase [Candidatus Neomarinimicrobiota bacterium]
MKISKVKKSRKSEINYDNLLFGKYFSDHMYMQDYTNGKWQEPEIVPFEKFPMSPANITLHYGQSIFEGMKAFKGVDGKIRMFRPKDNIARLNRSAKRMAMAQVNEDDFMNGLKELIQIDKDLIPDKWGESLYLRPFLIATDEMLGLKASSTYRFMIIASPVASYYAEGLNPIKIKVETEFSRVVEGGLGEVKAAANYAASVYATKVAKDEGFSQVLWLDGKEHRYVDEVGAMNMMFVIDDVLVTPTLEQKTILPGITRYSALTIARELGWKVEERRIEIEEIAKASENGKLQEAFGIGTAAIISPVGEMFYKGRSIIVNDRKIGEKSQKLYDIITGIQYGEIKDTHGWTVVVR